MSTLYTWKFGADVGHPPTSFFMGGVRARGGPVRRVGHMAQLCCPVIVFNCWGVWASNGTTHPKKWLPPKQTTTHATKCNENVAYVLPHTINTPQVFYPWQQIGFYHKRFIVTFTCLLHNDVAHVLQGPPGLGTLWKAKPCAQPLTLFSWDGLLWTSPTILFGGCKLTPLSHVLSYSCILIP
jgi:hypothetical protein